MSGLSGAANLEPAALTKTIFLEVVSNLEAHGFDAIDIPAKIEGLAFAPDVSLAGERVHTLFITNDNDFLASVTDTHHPDGIDNPNRFFVFAVPPSVLPDFVAQKLQRER